MNTDEEKTLDLLRDAWCKCREFRTRFESGVPNDEWTMFRADVLGWTESVRQILSNVFFNQKFSDDYDKLIAKAYNETGDWLDPATAISLTQSYIQTLGKLYKSGYIKDPYSGINNESSRICFVAMWFDSQMDEVFLNGIKAPIEELGYTVVRVDKEQYNGRIDQKIIELIRKARFMVADLTGGSHGVYYESGFAFGQGIPVVRTCQIDSFDKRHFDVLMVNTIKYKDSAELASKLKIRVHDTIGKYLPPMPPPPGESDMPF